MLKDRAELKRNEGFQCPLYAEEILSCSEMHLESFLFAHETAQISGETCEGSIMLKNFHYYCTDTNNHVLHTVSEK